MKILFSVTFWSLMSMSIVFGKWYDMEPMVNIFYALFWLLVTIITIVMFIPYDQLNLTKLTKTHTLINFIGRSSTILLSFASGWFLTGVTLLVTWLLIHCKREVALKRQSQSS